MLLEQVIRWLLDGDVSIQYLTHRDLLGSDAGTIENLQHRIGQEGYGAAILSRRSESGHWGLWFLSGVLIYQETESNLLVNQARLVQNFLINIYFKPQRLFRSSSSSSNILSESKIAFNGLSSGTEASIAFRFISVSA